MGKIYYMMGKSSTGKDTLYKRIFANEELQLKTVVLYTTRPIRDGENEGVEYFFCDTKKVEELEAAGKVIERRDYNTIHGIWTYFTVDDGQIDLEGQDYLFISTLSGYEQLKKFYGEDVVLPLYVEVEDDQRLWRSICRERKQAKPNYDEVCRRFLADQQDFSEEEIIRLGIRKRYRNSDLEECVKTIARDIGELREK